MQRVKQLSTNVGYQANTDDITAVNKILCGFYISEYIRKRENEVEADVRSSGWWQHRSIMLELRKNKTADTAGGSRQFAEDRRCKVSSLRQAFLGENWQYTWSCFRKSVSSQTWLQLVTHCQWCIIASTEFRVFRVWKHDMEKLFDLNMFGLMFEKQCQFNMRRRSFFTGSLMAGCKTAASRLPQQGLHGLYRHTMSCWQSQ